MAPKRNSTDLLARQELFCREYLKDLKAAHAAVRAGYSDNAPQNTASILMKQPKIKARLKVLMDERAQRVEIDADAVLQALASLAFANLGDFVKWGPDGVIVQPSNKLTKSQLAAVLEVSDTEKDGHMKVRLHDKVRALELLGKHLRLFGSLADNATSGDFKFLINVTKNYAQADSNGQPGSPVEVRPRTLPEADAGDGHAELR